MTAPLDLGELERLARAATTGRWIVRDDDNEHRRLIGANINADGTMRGDGMRNGGIWVVETKGPDCHANAAFIAASNPSAVLSLIEEVKRLRVLLDNLVIAQSLSREIRTHATEEARFHLYQTRAALPAPPAGGSE